jgi:hypothetical protein
MPTKDKLDLLRELRKRALRESYRTSFEKFAEDHIKILPKSVTQGFIPFRLNAAQKIINDQLEEQHRKTGRIRAIILKARQMGISTLIVGRLYHRCYFNQYIKAVVMAHDTTTSDALFNMSKELIARLPEEYAPVLKKSNAKEIMFDGTGSGYKLYTAGSPEAGRGTTPTAAHLSEVAFWPFDSKILAGLFQGIPNEDDTEIILESTANGVGNEFHRLWKDAVAGKNEYLPIFVPWFLVPEYRRKTPEGFQMEPAEESMAKKYGLDPEQVYWRRLKIAETSEDKFKQEYPATADEAFVSSGVNVFDQEKLGKLLPQPILERMNFNFEKSDWEAAPRGALKIYQYPRHDEPYVIGSDVSLGVGKDYSTAVVLTKEKKVVATYRHNLTDPSAFGDVLFYLARKFNNALLGVESNSMGVATLNRLVQMKYPNLYYQVKIANLSTEEGERPGWRTTLSSKPAVIGFLKSAVDNDELWIPCLDLISELQTYVSDEKGATKAAIGCNDDLVMALAISLEVLRTHGHRLQVNRVPYTQQVGQIKQDRTVWL